MKSSNEKEKFDKTENRETNFKTMNFSAKEKPGKEFGKRKRSTFGRPNSLSDEKLQELMDIYYTKPLSLRQLGDMFGVSRMTIWRLVQTMELGSRVNSNVNSNLMNMEGE